MRADQPMREQVQPQVDVVGVGRARSRGRRARRDRLDRAAAALVARGRCGLTVGRPWSTRRALGRRRAPAAVRGRGRRARARLRSASPARCPRRSVIGAPTLATDSPPRTPGTAQPVRSTWSDSSTSTSSSPPSSTTVTGESPPRSTCATAAPQAPVPEDMRLPHAALEDPRADAVGASSVQNDTLVRLGNAASCSIGGPSSARSSASSSSGRRRGSSTAGCRSRRAGSAAPQLADAVVGRREVRSAVARPMSVRHVRSPVIVVRISPATVWIEKRVGRPSSRAAQVEQRLARAVARQLGLGAVGVEDPQARRRSRARRRARARARRRRHAVMADRTAAAHLLGVERQRAASRMR